VTELYLGAVLSYNKIEPNLLSQDDYFIFSEKFTIRTMFHQCFKNVENVDFVNLAVVDDVFRD
jgi:hypothetical protein